MRSALALLPLALVAGCGGGSSSPMPDLAMTVDPFAAVPLSNTFNKAGLSGPVDVVRDEWGIPHIYGDTLGDVMFADGYVTASDRFIEMDLFRRAASGTLAEIGGDLSADLIDRDVATRMHHQRTTAAAAWDQLKASQDPDDLLAITALSSYAAGVNAYLTDLQNHDASLPPAFLFAFDAQTSPPWTEVDSLVIGRLQAFELSFDGDEDIYHTTIRQAALAQFDQSNDPAHKRRAGIAADWDLYAPIDPTYIRPGFNDGTGAPASAPIGTARVPTLPLDLLRQAGGTLAHVGLAKRFHPSRGSNNWVVGPGLTASGHVLLANDTHLTLQDPPVFYLHHLVVRDPAAPLDVMGEAFPGIPGCILGHNDKAAWGATVNVDDVTDVYAETIVPCDDGKSPCVMFQGKKVALVPRTETIKVGRFGTISSTKTVTLWDVPHHGPIIPRLGPDHAPLPLGAQELSVRYTGYDVSQDVRAVLGMNRARSMSDVVAALDKDFKFGGQNWVIGDVDGHFGWTTIVRVPKRAAGAKPWYVLPGDGSAEWTGDLDPHLLPHDYDPARGFVVTANNDPVGVTDGNDPLSGPVYLAARYIDPGARAGRITKLLKERMAAGKLTIDDLKAVQRDARSFLGALLAPTVADSVQALLDERKTPGTNADLTALAAKLDDAHAAALADAVSRLRAWSFDTPSATAAESPTPEEIADSAATSIFNAWLGRALGRALDDEAALLGGRPGDGWRLFVKMMLTPEKLATGVAKETGDSILWDDLATPNSVESKRFVVAAAMIDALDYLGTRFSSHDSSAWRWGEMHHLIAEGMLPLDAARLPPSKDPAYPNGFPRHGDNHSVDAAFNGDSTTDFDYHEGPAIRFTVELDPATGPRASNALPGGETFDPGSPHFRDQMERWRKNDPFELHYRIEDVVKNASDHVRFAPGM